MNTYQDGVLEFGTQALTIGALTNLVADDISVDDDTTVLTRKNGQGVPTDETQIDGVLTGTATIQMSAATMALPAKGTGFTLVDVTGTPLNFKVNKWGRAWKNDGETKIKLTFRTQFHPAGN